MSTDPLWLVRARALVGTREAPGVANNPTIIGWARALAIKVLGVLHNADSGPWCGVFVAENFREAGVHLSSMKIGVRATSWATWGKPIARDMLAPSAVLVFQRPGGRPVGEDWRPSASWVAIRRPRVDARIEKARCIAARRPSDQPLLGHPILMTTSGVPASTNEA
ncbi:C40 family peptidase [Sphingomonas nostoxanthinifaciens]|uniref:hypothetical protein n=1 Tax=Sphingomonas nostoxanthinifaciens TaxID=2872652 RepID=UPI001CC1F72D|nr:hypothetical protein [Sphingomonas nostoxanthinifaciens]UAK25697.1 hypothetical protein K8P63_06050 [Sphingomonas nostoxanthinifaciens]